ncbi:hypothetical protein JM93_03968 [Roseibium hamelinense]|uniref:Uncharacterized protein n=1 Tax=Roseibium hamelinense TaxID=150831 RepID=A0A562SII3_9HYPH|nr:hypothetical protein [Roseibium hamelinense]MTI43951.1 hypothetical protein [Roseibium hamelinense]TWI80754.1 hypothetical protein JM93_03968 [Roseibium hamelinense]
MERQDIISDLATAQALPWRTLKYCLETPEVSQPVFLSILQHAAHGRAVSPLEQRAMFFGVHVLGAQKCIAAFEPLFLLLNGDELCTAEYLGDAIAVSIPQVLMGFSENRAKDLWDGIGNPDLDWLIHEVFLNAWAFEVLNGRFPIGNAQKLLSALPDNPAIDDDSPLWSGWMNTIADLALKDMIPIVDQCLESGRILQGPLGISTADYEVFKTDLAEAAKHNSDPAWRREKGYLTFAGTEEAFEAALHVAPWTSLDPFDTAQPLAAEEHVPFDRES